MIYLDYAANTPVDPRVLQTYCDVTTEYAANPNSTHPLGLRAKAYLDQCTEEIAQLLGVLPEEIIYTSGASESNNLAIKGAAGQYKKYGRHIVTTMLEHSSVNGAVGYLESLGFEVDYADITPDGLVDLDSLKVLLRDDTILVSVCAVDSEIGLKQDIGKIAEIVKGLPHCLFHVDATQAVGKIPLCLDKVDLVTFAPHKFYGPNGCGVLIKKAPMLLEPLIHGGISTTPFRSGTPALPLIAAMQRALSLTFSEMDTRYDEVSSLNHRLREAFSGYKGITVNSTTNAVPFILNISLPGVKTEEFAQALAEKEIYLSTKSACCAPNTVSRPVYALTKNKKAALSTLRISLSHLTTQSDVESFLTCFDRIYKSL